MPASPARALRGRGRRLAAGVCALARSCPRPRWPPTVRSPSARPRLACGLDDRVGVGAVRPGDARPVRHSVADVCDTTLVHVDGDGTLALELKAGEGTPDVDLYVYRSDSFGFAGALAGVAAESGADEAVRLPNASGTLPGAGGVVRDGSGGSPARPRSRRRQPRPTSTAPAAARRRSSATIEPEPRHSRSWP